MDNKKPFSGRALVIQVRSREIRVAAAVLGAAPRLKTCVTMPLPEGAVADGTLVDPDAVRDALKSAVSQPGLRGIKRAVITVCTSQILSEAVAVRAMKSRGLGGSPDKLMQKTLETNRDMYFPVDTKNCRLVWTPIGDIDDEDGSPAKSVQLWAVPNPMLEEYYKLANSCGLKVLAVDYCGNSFTSLIRAGYAAPQPKKKQKVAAGRHTKKAAAAGEGAPEPDTVLYLLPEEDFLLMTFVRDRQVTRQRILARGDAYVDELEDARMVLELYETEHAGAGQIVAVVCGPEGTDPDYLGRVEESLGLQTVQRGGALTGDWCLCLGAAATRTDFGDPALNFPGRPNLLQKFWQLGLVIIGGGVLLVTLTQFIGDSTVWSSAIHGKENERNALQNQLAPISGYKQNWQDYVNYYTKYDFDWKTLLGTDSTEEESGDPGILRTYNDNLSLILEELEKLLPEGVSVTEIGIAPEGLGLQIACESKQQVAYMIQVLRHMKYAGEPAYISDMTVGPGVSAFSVLSSLAQAIGAPEAPPTEGSAQDVTLKYAGVFDRSKYLYYAYSTQDEQTLIGYAEILSNGGALLSSEKNTVKNTLMLDPRNSAAVARGICSVATSLSGLDERHALYGTKPGQVWLTSTKAVQQRAFDRMLSNPYALYVLSNVIQADIDAEGSVFRGPMEDFAWDNVGEDWFSSMFSRDDLTRLQSGDYSVLMDKDEAQLEQMFRLFANYNVTYNGLSVYDLCILACQGDPTLYSVMAYYAAVERGLIIPGKEVTDEDERPVDEQTGFYIDPLTGLLVDPENGDLLFDKATGYYVDRDTNEFINKDTGILFDLNTGMNIDRVTKKLYDPSTGKDLDPVTDMRLAKYTWRLTTQLEAENLDISQLDWSKVSWTSIIWRIMKEDDVVDALRIQAELQLTPETTVDPDTGLAVDPSTGLLYEPNTGLYFDPETGHLVDKNGKEIDPLTDPRLSQFMGIFLKFAPSLGIDSEVLNSFDWTSVNWLALGLDWKNLTSFNNMNKLIDLIQKGSSGLPGDLPGVLPGGAELPEGLENFYVDQETGQLKDKTTGQVVDPSTNETLAPLLKAAEQYMAMQGVDISGFDWGTIDWRKFDWSEPASMGNLQELMNQIITNMSGGSGGTGGLPGLPGGLPGTDTPQVDTRLYITVSIPYKETLVQAEMNRRGLSRKAEREELDLEDFQ